ncbi:eukaryotic translation initiation factor 5A-2 [Xylaria arbuscula]|uniref:Eukaryotic translation initiation factor 5A n=1 Tax=Xylaria arbuscula TaxID=114810 RepID=A0A9W8TIV2_9PEZI|nr:eukaryotic translation initiation factor 5A-2 [Xylaria arbuscula]KAJ3564334.1 hypothetical protein NPX13_g7881 [Xylaria arbuscula]
MADDADYDFAAGGADASLTIPTQCSALRKNGLVVIKGRPCKIVDMSTSKTGKHGHAKVHLVAIDIFTGKKYEDLCPSTHNMDVPNVAKEQKVLMYVENDEILCLFGDDGNEDNTHRVPEGEIGDQIRSFLNEEGQPIDENKEIIVTLLTSMGETHAVKAELRAA